MFKKFYSAIKLYENKRLKLEINNRIAIFIGHKAKFLLAKVNTKTYFLTHNAGFFSCASVALEDLITKNPSKISSRFGMGLYKNVLFTNNWEFFYRLPSKGSINNNKNISKNEILDTSNWWKKKYKTLPIKKVELYILKYFSPSDHVIDLEKNLTKKYKLNFSQTIGVHYRGTDKYTDWDLTPISAYVDEIDKILKANRSKDILFLSDDLSAQLYVKKRFYNQNLVIIEELSTSSGLVGAHYAYKGNRIKQAQLYFAAVLMLSKCNYLITHTGNGALWEVLYRDSIENFIQL